MGLLFAYVGLALGVSFLCSVLEAALLSLTPGFVAARERDGAGDRLRRLKEEIDRPLAAILSLNTVAHTIGAAGAGAQAAKVFGNNAVAIFSAALTLLILVASEIVPKTLGAVYWRQLAPFVSAVVPVLIVLTYPLVLLSELLARLIAPSKRKGHTVNREEFSALADIVRREGLFDPKESRVLANVLRFRKLTAEDIMTPRIVVVGFDETQTIADVYADEHQLRFSRFPVYKGDLDNVTGMVLKHDMLVRIARDEDDTPLHTIRREIHTVSSKTRVTDLLDAMLRTRQHQMLVIGPYGGSVGVVTLEDVVETLIGMEIVDETDDVTDMQILARKQWDDRARRHGLGPTDAALVSRSD